MASANMLIAFYRDGGRDAQGRTLEEILAWNDDRLESCHDYIQTVFPIPETSAFGWNSPVLNEEVFKAFRMDASMRLKLYKAFERLLLFWGFQLGQEHGVLKICKIAPFDTTAGRWLVRSNHNHLRMTRAIRSLRILGLGDEAAAFYKALQIVQAETAIGKTSLVFWRRAATRPLWIAPDVDERDEHNAGGPEFFKKLRLR